MVTNQSNTPLFSIVIPARNEEKYLPKCLAAIQVAGESFQNNYEVIVVINRCTDNTEEIARVFGAKVVFDGSKNLAKIRNTGCAIAKGATLITVDADSIISDNMLIEIHRAMLSNRYIGGGVLIKPERYSLGIIVSALLLLPIVIRYGIACGLFFCRREDFQAINGFNEKMCSVEDIDFAVRLKRYGKTKNKRFKIFLKAFIITSCRKFDTFGDWYFIRHPIKFLTALRGKNKKLADQIWYDFEIR